MAKIYVLTDLEGVAGVARWNQTGADTPGYAEAKRLMTAELAACVQGIQDAEPEAEIWVWDAHGCGSIVAEDFPPGALLLNNGPVPTSGYLDESFDALFFLGQHAMAGTLNGNLAHSYSSKSIEYMTLNGVLVGEFGARAAFAGSMGVPTVFCSGDDRMEEEARNCVPDIVYAQVKRGLGPQIALHMAPADARALIHRKASEAVERIGQIAPFTLDGPPWTQEIRIWARTDPASYLRRGFDQLDARTFTKTAERLTDLAI